MKRSAALALLALGCSSGGQMMPNMSPDANDDRSPDGGPDRCDFFAGGRTCPTGQSCTLQRLEDGGVARHCVAGACDIVQQGCPNGQECAFASGQRTCIAEGTLAEGVACNGATSKCKKGLTCVLSGDAGSACTRFCRLDTDCAAGWQCWQTLTVAGSAELPNICTAPTGGACNPLLQNCPQAGDGCFPSANGTACYPSAGVEIGKSCSFSNACVRGAACSDNAGPFLCHQICAYPSGAPSCDSGQVCSRLGSLTNVGVCL